MRVSVCVCVCVCVRVSVCAEDVMQSLIDVIDFLQQVEHVAQFCRLACVISVIPYMQRKLLHKRDQYRLPGCPNLSDSSADTF